MAILLPVAVMGILLAAVLSAGETAVLRVTQGAITAAAQPRQVTRLSHYLNGRRRKAAQLAFGQLIAEMTCATAITMMCVGVFEQWWLAMLVALAITVVIAFGVVRISPRQFARTHPVKVLTRVGPILRVCLAVTAPIAPLVNGHDPSDDLTESEVRDLLELVRESQTVEDEDGELLQSAFELGETFTREVMVPRTSMVTIPASATLAKAMSLFLRSGYSRLPVTGQSMDDLTGVLYFKDVVAHLRNNPDGEAQEVGSLTRPAMFVPELKRVDDLLRDMQTEATHIAIVVDEYGGIAGLVTIEDALEEIVGDLVDEHDRGELQVEEVALGRYRVPARLSIDELGELFDLDIDDDDVDSVGGLLTKALGMVPLAGSTADVQGVHLVAERVEGRRRQVTTILVSKVAA